MNSDDMAILLSSGDHLIDALCAILLVLLPLWMLLHYYGKFRASRLGDARDSEAFEQLHRTAARMEQRMKTLERILDAEIPEWRKTADLGVHDDATI